MTTAPTFGIGRVTRFYVPLLLQAFSQCLTYPLVAGIVSKGEFGVNGLTAFSQGLMIMFMIAALGGGLVMTGMIFAKTREGCRAFRSLNFRSTVILLALQCLPALPPFGPLIFEEFFALPTDLARVARHILLASTVTNALFLLRNVPMVILLNHLQSGKCNTGTVLRVAFTLSLSVLLTRLGCVGPYWGLLALTLGVAVETGVTWAFARSYRRSLPSAPPDEPPVSIAALVRFTVPLSLGGFLLSISPVMVAAFIGQCANATDMLAVHYVTLGIANPAAYGALKMQAVTIEFPPAETTDRRLLFYAITAGAFLGLIPLAFSTPLVGTWYFGDFQNVPPRLLETVRLAVGLYAFIGIIQAVRGRAEGLAALAKRPATVMTGQIAYTMTLFAVLALLLPFGIPGWTMALTAVYTAPLAATVAIYVALSRETTPADSPSPRAGSR
jgi:hypothetical protein